MGDVDEGKQADKDEDDEKDTETEDKTAKEKKFVIVNFPTMPDFIKGVIEALLRSDNFSPEVKMIPQVQGYMLEQAFFDHIQKVSELSGTSAAGAYTTILMVKNKYK